MIPLIATEGVNRVKVVQAYRFAMDPSPAQERALRSHAGAARFAWNWALAKCQERYAAERRWHSGSELHKLWNKQKQADPELAWWPENSKCAYQEAFRDLDRALRDFVKSKKGERRGRRLGFPRFKKRGRCKDSFRLTGAVRCGRGQVTLPRLGVIKTHESTRKLARQLEHGTARILSATVSRIAQRWFVSFTVEVERDLPDRHPRRDTAIGIDLGVKTLITGVDDADNVMCVSGRRPLASGLRRLRRASRAHTRKRPGSARRRRSAGRLARLQARIANLRSDTLHKATTILAAQYETIVIEDLNVAGMTGNRRLARAISDQGFGIARQMLCYKTTRNGGTLITADRWYPSSKMCSGCGTTKAKLSLSERVYRCDACGLVDDRDVNAARNLLKLAASGAESLNASGGTVRPSLAGRVPANLEPGTLQREKTGTVSGQPLAAA
jgi:putative transposase